VAPTAVDGIAARLLGRDTGMVTSTLDRFLAELG
jgi:hypothetical protein